MSNAASAAPSLPFRQALLAMLGIGLVNMLVALDQTVVSTALPSIVSELKGFEYYAWVATAYLLASVVTVPIFGRLGDYFGRKRFVVASVVIFVAASILCGLAGSMPMLIAARGLQGFGGGMMVRTAFASVPDLFPDARTRVRWQVVLAAAYGVGTAAGPSLGGFLSEHYGWRSTFFINFPVGAASLYCISRYLPSIRHSRSGRINLDVAGAILIAITLGGLQMLVEGLPASGLSWANLRLVLLIAASIGLLLWCERRASHPILPLDLFRHADIVRLFMLSGLAGFVMFSLIFFAPLLLQGGFGLSPQTAGVLATPLAAFIAVGSILNTHIVVRLKQPTLILSLGFSLMLCACLGTAATFQSTGHWLPVLSMMAGGTGLGFVLNNMNIFGQEIAGRERFGITTALMQSTRMVGGMLGTTLIGTLVTHTYASGVAAAFKNLPGAEPASRWMARFDDPQILVDPASQNRLLSELAHTALSGPDLLQACRAVLVSAIHTGLLLTAAAALAAVLMVHKLRHIVLHKRLSTPLTAASVPE